jgi:hypothetical protein
MASSADHSTTTPPQIGFRRLWRTLRQLFHEVTGAMFAVLALAWLNTALRAWTQDVAKWMLGMAGCVIAVFLFFAITSFRRARKL